MGYRPSPYAAVRTFYHAEEFIIGDTNCRSNPFRWDDIVLNMPGGEFNPTKARVVRWDAVNKRVATDMLIYMDDLKVIAQTLELTWGATRRCQSRLQYQGIQDNPRKRRIDNGPWAGGLYYYYIIIILLILYYYIIIVLLLYYCPPL